MPARAAVPDLAGILVRRQPVVSDLRWRGWSVLEWGVSGVDRAGGRCGEVGLKVVFISVSQSELLRVY